jgi:hypothetical protein
MAGSFDAAVSRVARTQQRSITRQQLLALGVEDTAIRYRLRIGRLHRTPFPGVYTVGTPAITPHERAYAALLACGPTAMLAGASGMVLWAIWHRWEEPFEVTITSGDRRPKGVKVHRCHTLGRNDIKRQYGIPVTSPARTIHDMEPRLTDRQLTRVVNSALHDLILREDALAELLVRHPNERLAYFIDSAPSDSLAEDEFPEFCVTWDIPVPIMHARVNGRIVDAFWAEEKVIAELDGWGFHNTIHDFENDRGRDIDNLVIDCPTMRITRRKTKREPARLAGQILTILANRRRQLGRAA